MADSSCTADAPPALRLAETHCILRVMTMPDPYLTLGLHPAADSAAIKAAYRQSVRVAHPDRGGDADDFIAVVKAFGVLSDPVAKRLFDETGQIDETGARDYRQEVVVILADMFDTAVATALSVDLPLHTVNFIEQMSAVVQVQLLDANDERQKLDRQIHALEDLRARIKRRDGATNLFVLRLNEQVRAKVEAHRASLRRLALLETAASELANYDSETELFSALDVA
ncbi:MAG: DnaJ domain-containing protein [Devosia sp.]